MKANNKVEADRGRIAVERGPIVYCAEWPDNDFDVLSVFINLREKYDLYADSIHEHTQTVKLEEIQVKYNN